MHLQLKKTGWREQVCKMVRLQWFIMKEWWGGHMVQRDEPITKATHTKVPATLAGQPFPTATIALRELLLTDDF